MELSARAIDRKFPGRRRLSILILATLLACSPLDAQYDSLLIPTDTSYFQEGKDNWNLVESVLQGDPANVLLLLRRGANPDACAEGGMSALMFAAENNDTLSIRILILNGADTEFSPVEQTTPLMVAVLNGHFDAAHLLLRMGADPGKKDVYGGSALLYAAALNDYALADLLIYFGADPSQTDRKGNTALMTAVTEGGMETSDVLLQNQCDPDEKDLKGNTPLMIAAQQDHKEMAGLLLEYGAGLDSTNRQHYTALAHAIRSGHAGMARMLADSGSNIHHQITPKQNLYDLAILQGELSIAADLKKRGAGPSPRPDFSEIHLRWGNSFNGADHLMQVHLVLMDRKYGFFAVTGMDFRPLLHTVQVEQSDGLIHQYRESRWAWSHGVGKNFTLARDEAGISYGFYAGLNGLLSFASYRGMSQGSGAHYSLLPSGGFFVQGKLAGIRAGMERYHFGTILEKKWKMNISLFVRIPFKNNSYEIKEISY